MTTTNTANVSYAAGDLWSGRKQSRNRWTDSAGLRVLLSFN